jgi:hypothetical protein
MDTIADRLSKTIRTLTPEQIAEVQRFIATLQPCREDAVSSRSSASLSDPAFAAIWSNPEDDVYDAL